MNTDKQRSGLRNSVVLTAVLAASCVTVNIYFPAPEIREAAEQIVEETWGDAQLSQADRPKSTIGIVMSGLVWALRPSIAHAGDVDIDVSTAGIRALKDAMTKRAMSLKPWLYAGRIGVALDGTLAVRDLEGVALSEQAGVRRLLAAENRDRHTLYEEIAAANGLASDRVDDIEQIFASTWTEQAQRSGWWTKSEDGQWGKR